MDLDSIRGHTRRLIRPLLAVFLVVSGAASARAQTPASGGPNAGALTFSGGLDVPSIYYFRGIRQEGDPALTLWPYGTLTVRIASPQGALNRIEIGVSTWNSLHTGTSGTGGPTDKLHYEEVFSSTLSLGFSRGLKADTAFVAYTSPNGSFQTIREVDFKLSQSGWIAPYVLAAVELGGQDAGQADEGAKTGSYLEIGAAPNRTIWRVTVSVPLKVGVSLADYYEVPTSSGKTADHGFGFFEVGGLAAFPLSRLPTRFGSWDVHGGVEFLTLGDGTKALNLENGTAVVGSFGVGVRY